MVKFSIQFLLFIDAKVLNFSQYILVVKFFTKNMIVKFLTGKNKSGDFFPKHKHYMLYVSFIYILYVVLLTVFLVLYGNSATFFIISCLFFV